MNIHFGSNSTKFMIYLFKLAQISFSATQYAMSIIELVNGAFYWYLKANIDTKGRISHQSHISAVD